MPTDPRGLRGDAPLLDAWLRFHERPPTPFTIPGHKQRHDLVGDVVAGDVPLYAGLDTMKLTSGVLADAEARAARLWGADVCRFSTGGATHANQAVALAVAGDGDRVVVSRTLHRSLLLGLVLAGLTPVWVRPEVDPATGLPSASPRPPCAVPSAEHPDARAVLVGDPSYVGTVGDVAGLAEAAHEHDVPLVVDAAWAAHFGFHPELPRHALELGADVVVTSAHKTLPARSQAALVLARTGRVDAGAARRRCRGDRDHQPGGRDPGEHRRCPRPARARRGALLGTAIAATRAARDRRASRGSPCSTAPASTPLKLTLVLAGTGADGNAVERDLLAAGLPVEMADRDVVVAVVSLADTPASLEALAESLVALGRAAPRRPATGGAGVWRSDPSSGARAPAAQAYFAPRERAARPRRGPRLRGAGRAVPARHPGARPRRGGHGRLARRPRAGAGGRAVRIAYAADPTVRTLDVVAE